MDYVQGAVALVGLSISGIVVLATLNWTINHSKLRTSTAWLSAYAIIGAMQFLEFIYQASGLYMKWPVLYKVIDPFAVLLPLFLYGYIRELQGDHIFRNKLHAFYYLSPGILVLMLDFHLWIQPVEVQLDMILRGRNDESTWDSWAPYGNNYLLIIAGQCLLYWWLQNRQSYQGRKANISLWINRAQLLQLVTFTAILVRVVLLEVFDVRISMAYAMAPFAVYFIYILLSVSELPQPLQTQAKNHTKSHKTNGKTNGKTDGSTNDQPDSVEDDSSEITASDQDPLSIMFQDLEKVLRSGGYKENDLSLNKIAAACGLTTHQASAAINKYSGNNFYEWVNQYRIEAAKKALLETDTPVTKICFEVGFNSKSTFNMAFKRMAGCTPTEFRKTN